MRDDDEIRATRQRVERVVSQLMLLSRSEEACRLLGVDGVLVDKVDLTVLEDPLDYLAHDIASAVRDTDRDAPPVQATHLSTLLAELRLCGLTIPRIDQQDLVERVLRYIQGQDR